MGLPVAAMATDTADSTCSTGFGASAKLDALHHE